MNKKNIIIKVNHDNKNYELSIPLSINVSELRHIIFSKLSLDIRKYSITYKCQKLSKDDSVPLFIFFKKDPKPLLFINDNKSILPTLKPSDSVTISTKIKEQKLFEVISHFFKYKYLLFDANIKKPSKNVYTIKFQNSKLASDFRIFYKKFRQNNNRHKNLRPIKNQNQRLPNVLFQKSLSTNNLDCKNERAKLLNNVISTNYKSELLSEKNIRLGIDKYHRSIFSTKIRKNGYNGYEGMYEFPFMNPDERYNREQFLDKKNWIDKKGFILSVGKYKMKDNFIPNYVSATPSESPLSYRYRDINKSKWYIKRGFFL